MMYELEESDSAMRAKKPANKAGQPVAEWAEQRAGTKGNTGQPHTRRTQSRDSVSQGLDRVRHVCRQTPEVGAVCPNWARTDLCGGCPVTGIPTAITAHERPVVVQGSHDHDPRRSSPRLDSAQRVRRASSSCRP
jgi:hypothetical protein